MKILLLRGIYFHKNGTQCITFQIKTKLKNTIILKNNLLSYFSYF